MKNECPICYEHVPMSHPRTCCCKQLIHTHCLQQCMGCMNISCPLCRAMMSKYPNTRNTQNIVTNVRNCVNDWNDTMPRVERAVKMVTLLKYLHEREHILKVCFNPIWTMMSAKKLEIVDFLDENVEVNSEDIRYIKHLMYEMKFKKKRPLSPPLLS